ncbi:MAG: transcriptional regulator [Burkholderiales bacterium RIFCSPLOWO2_12_67_14]|nr:MAG: transcriptional regulator [Burkholderiales bacterium RIFCSPLOWO2_02_FULL_67_64]OGB41892.1 MAG: transcriptional regulator [Burkholderiales bacterium RIFCSPLOWO2_12_67_14]OGB46351.1 MAG: transcriptional regulator [Burkholderiales bacterium RIFCSPHIGHO2_12_FULL_67_38]
MSTRERTIDTAVRFLDDPMFKALQEPVRVAVLRELLLLGRADVGSIAERLPQERSVISRHLQILLDAGLLIAERDGRHRIYEVNGPEVLRRFEVIVGQIRTLVQQCCPD